MALSVSEVRGKTFPLVTVTYLKEIELLKIQARSLASNIDFNSNRKFVIICNDDFEKFLDVFNTQVLPEYGVHAPCVEVFDYVKLIGNKYDHLAGWVRQQILKLSVAKILNPEDMFYVCLDTKNVLIKNWSDEDLITSNNKVRLHRRAVSLDNPMNMMASHNYYNEGKNNFPEHYANIITPFPMSTHYVREMLSQPDLLDDLANDPLIFEFGLYYSYLISIGHEDIHQIHDPAYVATLWYNESEQFTNFVFELIRRPDLKWFGLHRKIINANDTVKNRVIDMLCEMNVFKNSDEAAVMIGKIGI